MFIWHLLLELHQVPLQVLKSAIQLFLDLVRCGLQLDMLLELVTSFYHLLGSNYEDSCTNGSNNQIMNVLTEHTLPSIFVLVTACLERLLDEVDFGIHGIESLKVEGGGCSSMDAGLDALYQRLLQVEEISVLIARSCLLGPTMEVHALKLFVKLYKSLDLAVKSASQRYPSQAFHRMVQCSGRKLTPSVYILLEFLQKNDEQETATKVRKESTLKPNLVYAIEKYEAALIKLSKLHKIELLRGFKRSQARDFRIHRSKLEKELASRNEESQRSSDNSSTA